MQKLNEKLKNKKVYLTFKDQDLRFAHCKDFVWFDIIDDFVQIKNMENGNIGFYRCSDIKSIILYGEK